MTRARRNPVPSQAAPDPAEPHPTPEQLAAIPLMECVPRRELAAVSRLFSLRSYPREAIVAVEGRHVDDFHLILSGSVQAFWRDEAGHQLKLGVDGPGGHFPDVCLGGEPVLASWTAVSDLQVAAIPLGAFRELLERHPKMTYTLLMDVVARLRRMVQRSRHLTMEDVYGRVVKLILAACVQEGGRLVSEPLTHAEIGNRVGATREMVGRVIRALVKGGYLQAERGRLVLLRKPPARW